MVSRSSGERNAQPSYSLRERLRYKIDNHLARGVTPLMGLLAVCTLLTVVIAGILIWIARVRVNGAEAKGIEGTWLSLLRTLDPGTMGSDQGWHFRLTSLSVTIVGILIGSTLIGLSTNGIDRRLNDLRRGQSTVIERGHTLVLGWSSKLNVLIKELADAADGGEVPVLVVLAERDNVEMLDELSRTMGSVGKVRIVTRSGVPSSPADLERVAPLAARSVVIFGDGLNGDAETIRIVLALEHIGLPEQTPVVIELADGRHATAITLASGLNLFPVVPDRWIADVTARAVRHPLLADVFEDLLNFAGAEIYFHRVPADLAGTTLRDMALRVQGGAVFGIHRDGDRCLAIVPDELLRDGDQLVVVADSASPIAIGPSVAYPILESRDGVPRTQERDLIGIVGWSQLGAKVLARLDQAVPAGSIITVLCPPDQDVSALEGSFGRFEVRVLRGDTSSPDDLRRFLAFDHYTRVLVLSDDSGATIAERDAAVLLTMLELRHLRADHGDVAVTVELSDPRNVQLVQASRREEFIVGERLTCLLMSQVSQNSDLLEILSELLSADGPELVTVPTLEFLPVGETAQVGSLIASTLARGTYLIGLHTSDGLQLHPDPAERYTCAEGDELIVVRSST